MDKIVGNTCFWRGRDLVIKPFLLVLLFCSFNIQGAQLTICSQDGAPLKSAGVGQPFLLKCTLSYEDGNMHEPKLEGMHDMIVHRTGFHVSTINRSSRATYTYQVRARKTGHYTLGPIKFVQNGKELATNTVQLTVGDKEEIDTQKANEATASVAFARLMVSKREAYVGEKITYTVRFYYQDPSTQIEHFSRPTLDSFKIAEQSIVREGQEKIKDTVYRFKEWSWELSPKHVGELVIEPHRFDFMQESSSNNPHISRLQLFWGPPVEHKRLYTNSLTVTVLPLPPHTEPVVGVGSFKQLRAQLEPGVAKEGEAMVYTLAIEGDGGMDDLQFPLLHGLPESFKSYPSKQYMQTSTPGKSIKCFEFILQGMKAGNWEIPAQTCAYFDVHNRQYKTLSTSPLLATVVPVSYSKNTATAVDGGSIESIQSDEQLLGPLATSCGDTEPERSLPFYLLAILGLLPWIGYFVYRSVGPLYVRYAQRRSRSRSYYLYEARKSLQAAELMRDVTHVYPLFVELIAGLYGMPIAEVTQEYMRTLFADIQWTVFVDRAAEYAFYVPRTTEQTLLFFKEGSAWLERIEKQL